MKLKERIEHTKNKIAQVYIAIKSKNTPWFAKVLGSMTIAYALSPIDLIPDFIPIIGYLDDLIILPILVYFTIKCIPKTIWDSFEEEAKTLWQNGKPRKWGFAVFVIIVWTSLFGLLLYTLLK